MVRCVVRCRVNVRPARLVHGRVHRRCGGRVVMRGCNGGRLIMVRGNRCAGARSLVRVPGRLVLMGPSGRGMMMMMMMIDAVENAQSVIDARRVCVLCGRCQGCRVSARASASASASGDCRRRLEANTLSRAARGHEVGGERAGRLRVRVAVCQTRRACAYDRRNRRRVLLGGQMTKHTVNG